MIFIFWLSEYLYLFYKISKLAADTQLFIHARNDFGTALQLLEYVTYWQSYRGKAAILVLNHKPWLTKKLAQSLCPTVLVIYSSNFSSKLSYLFGKGRFYLRDFLYKKKFSLLIKDRVNSIYLYDSIIFLDVIKANYSEHLDENVENYSGVVSSKFLDAYIRHRRVIDGNQCAWKDFRRLKSKPSLKITENLQHLNLQLISNLKVVEPYVVFNINCKNYVYETNRGIKFPERYNVLIDLIISKGYNVIIQGRKEQPSFKNRKGLIDYSRSFFCSPDNDLALFSGAKFAVFNKTGPENFASIFNLPFLSLDFTEWAALGTSLNSRFYPKHILDSKIRKEFSWNEILTLECFFDIGSQYSNEKFLYLDMEESEIFSAGEEFLELINKKEFQWDNYSLLQKQFRNSLTPLHLDMFESKIVPCECYLNKFQSSVIE